MSSSSSFPPNSGDDTRATSTGTVVDLAEDLLAEPTTQIAGTSPSSPSHGAAAQPSSEFSSSGVFDADDQLESAKILLGEGLIEEAKKTLRAILRQVPDHVGAKKKLEELHDIELKQLFGDYPVMPSPNRRGRPVMREIEWDSQSVIAGLDRDLSLSLEPSPASVLFGDGEQVEAFIKKLDTDLASLEPSDRIDVGIAFLEMGLLEVAIRQFSAVATRPAYAAQASCLLAQALIASGRAFDAVITLEAILLDGELGSEQRMDFHYWMGRAQESLDKIESARQWYARVAQVNSKYRDIGDRIRRCERGRS